MSAWICSSYVALGMTNKVLIKKPLFCLLDSLLQ